MGTMIGQQIGLMKMIKNITKSKKINYNFGEKHKQYIRDCRDNLINVAEGAVRAGKTVDNVFAFAMELETTPDKIHLATGSTSGNAKLNISECDGFGLEHIFRGRCRLGSFKDNDCLYVRDIFNREKIVIFSGGAKANNYKSIRGNSYGLWIATEINLHHPTMITEAFNRQLMAKNRKIFWDLNPSRPNHFIYEDYIDQYALQEEKGKFIGGFNHQTFNIFDNVNLTKARIKEIESQYDPNSVWYRRDILGRRTVAEGNIYRTFANNPLNYLIDNPDIEYQKITIGVDFGGNKASHTFVATGITPIYENVIVIATEKHRANIDPTELGERFVKFVRSIIDRYGFVNYIYPDSAEQVLIRGLRTSLQLAGLTIPVRDSKKEPIIDRIRATETLISQNRLFYTKDSETFKTAISEAVWADTKDGADERLDDGTSDIDTLDAFEYSFERDIRRLIKRGG